MSKTSILHSSSETAAGWQDLRDLLVPDILSELHKLKKTGILYVSRKGVKKQVYIKDGLPIAARSNLKAERIGEFLVTKGAISRSQQQEAIALQKKAAKSFGAILVEAAMLDKEALFTHARRQFLTILFSLFGLQEGFFKFEETDLPTNMYTYNVTFSNLITFGIRQITDPRIVKEVVGDFSQVPTKTASFSEYESLMFTEKELAVVNAIDGSKTIQEIFNTTNVKLLLCLKTLLLLKYHGHVQFQVNFEDGEIDQIIDLEEPAAAAFGFSTYQADDPEEETAIAGSDFLVTPESVRAVLEEKAARQGLAEEPLAKNMDAREEKGMAGNLKDRQLPEILATLRRQKKTGILYIAREKVKKHIYIQEGVPISARSNMKSELLGEFLVARSVITRKDQQRTLDLLNNGGKSFGAVLLEQDLIGGKELFTNGRRQFLTILFSVFGLTQGFYKFKEEELPEDLYCYKVNFSDLLTLGIRQLSDTKVITGMVGGGDRIVVPAERFSQWEEMKLTENETSIVHAIDGKRTIDELQDSAPGEGTTVLKTLLILRMMDCVDFQVDSSLQESANIVEMEQAVTAALGFNRYDSEDTSEESAVAGTDFMIAPESLEPPVPASLEGSIAAVDQHASEFLDADETEETLPAFNVPVSAEGDGDPATPVAGDKPSGPRTIGIDLSPSGELESRPEQALGGTGETERSTRSARESSFEDGTAALQPAAYDLNIEAPSALDSHQNEETTDDPGEGSDWTKFGFQESDQSTDGPVLDEMKEQQAASPFALDPHQDDEATDEPEFGSRESVASAQAPAAEETKDKAAEEQQVVFQKELHEALQEKLATLKSAEPETGLALSNGTDVAENLQQEEPITSVFLQQDKERKEAAAIATAAAARNVVKRRGKKKVGPAYAASLLLIIGLGVLAVSPWGADLQEKLLAGLSDPEEMMQTGETIQEETAPFQVAAVDKPDTAQKTESSRQTVATDGQEQQKSAAPAVPASIKKTGETGAALMESSPPPAPLAVPEKKTAGLPQKTIGTPPVAPVKVVVPPKTVPSETTVTASRVTLKPLSEQPSKSEAKSSPVIKAEKAPTVSDTPKAESKVPVAKVPPKVVAKTEASAPKPAAQTSKTGTADAFTSQMVEWTRQLREIPATRYTIQVEISSNLKTVRNDLAILGSEFDAKVVPYQVGSWKAYTLVVGVFDSRQQGNEALKTLPRHILDQGPLVKTMRTIQKGLMISD